MSPPSKRIEEWINHMGFTNADEVKAYVNTHGGASLAMDATINFVFGTGTIEENPLPSFIPMGQTPLEQLQTGEGLPETPIAPFEQYPPVPFVQYPYPPVPPAGRSEAVSIISPLEREVKKSIFRRFLDWLGGS